jgi:hypothetical protein
MVQPVPEATSGKTRLHLDVLVGGSQAGITRVNELGGSDTGRCETLPQPHHNGRHPGNLPSDPPGRRSRPAVGDAVCATRQTGRLVCDRYSRRSAIRVSVGRPRSSAPATS